VDPVSQLMPVSNLCPQTLHDRFPVPAFLSSLTITEFSWLQNKQEKVVASGSFCSGSQTGSRFLALAICMMKDLLSWGPEVSYSTSSVCPRNKRGQGVETYQQQDESSAHHGLAREV
jgi:hypothetical protein